MMKTLQKILFVCLALIILNGSAYASKRVALVIGNNNYSNILDLEKAINDAQAIAGALSDVGFTVSRAENVNRREMNRQIQLFTSQLDVGDEALFFFAGHGVEIEGRNYLLPTDIPNSSPGQEGFVKSEAVAVDEVLDRIRVRKTRLSILILDACRDNPFPSNGTRSTGGASGLALMQPPEGTFILYSAGVGQTALDGISDAIPTRNSVFTHSLIPLINTPGLSLVQTARQVRRDVQKLASTVSHNQRPAYYDEIVGDFYFSGRNGEAANTLPAMELALWEAIKDSSNETLVLSYLTQYPNGVFAAAARARISAIGAGGVAVGSKLEPSGLPDGWSYELTTGHSGSVNSVAFNADGTVLASGSEDDTVKLWRVSDGSLIRTLEGHSGFVKSVAFNADGTVLASGSGDKTVKLWRVVDGNELMRIAGYIKGQSASVNEGVLSVSDPSVKMHISVRDPSGFHVPLLQYETQASVAR